MANMLVPAMIDDPLSTGAEPSSHPSYTQPSDHGGHGAPARAR